MTHDFRAVFLITDYLSSHLEDEWKDMEGNKWIMKPPPLKKKKSTQKKNILLIRIRRILIAREGDILMANFRELNV